MTFVPNWQVVYMMAIVFALLFLGAMVAHAARFRFQSGATWLAVFCVGAFVWSTLVAAMALSPPSQAGFWLKLKYGAIAFTPVAMLGFILTFVGVSGKRRRLLLRIACIVPLASLVVVWGGSLYELMVRSVSFARVGMLTYVERIVFGPFYWLFVAQGYLIVFLCVGLILAAMRRAAPLMRAQALALLAGILLPSVANLLLITGAAPRQFDPMPLGIALAAATLWWASMRHRILDLVPVVRSEMVDVSTDGMLALDAAERVIDANPAMAAILGHDAKALVGMPLLGALRRAPALMRRLLAEPGTDVDADATVDIGERAYALRVVLLGEPGKLNRGRLVALHDVTERRRLARERERLIDELRGALAEVRTLSGLLPVCAGCKQIRTEAGGWLPIDDYIAEHSEAQVSHTICPDCQSRFYPDTEAHGG